MSSAPWLMLFGAVVVGVGVVGWVLWPSPQTGSEGRPVQTAEAGGVTVTATHLDSSGETLLRVVIDTHTTDLSGYNLSASVHLEREGAAPSRVLDEPAFRERTSHHIEADLRFPAVEGPFVLVLTDLAGVPERRLTFA